MPLSKRAALLISTAALTAAALPAAAQVRPGEVSAVPPARTGRVEANGVTYYYEIRGQGEPLLLLHGGLGTIEMFAPILPALGAGRQVIAVDLHGHGRTPLGDRPMDLVAMGRDMGVILERLGLRTVDVLGYSLGAGVAFQLAIQQPARVRRLCLVSAAVSQDAFYPEILGMQAQVGAAMAEHMRETPMYRSYAAVAPDPSAFPKLLDAIGDLMRRPYDWSGDVAKLSMPVMLVYGDADMFRPEHMVRFYQLLGGGQRDAGWQREHMSRNRLAILPGVTHYDIFFSPQLAPTVRPFLDGQERRADWQEPPAR